MKGRSARRHAILFSIKFNAACGLDHLKAARISSEHSECRLKKDLLQLLLREYQCLRREKYCCSPSEFPRLARLEYCRARSGSTTTGGEGFSMPNRGLGCGHSCRPPLSRNPIDWRYHRNKCAPGSRPESPRRRHGRKSTGIFFPSSGRRHRVHQSCKGGETPFSYRCEGNVAWLVSTSTSIGRLWDSGRMEDPVRYTGRRRDASLAESSRLIAVVPDMKGS